MRGLPVRRHRIQCALLVLAAACGERGGPVGPPDPPAPVELEARVNIAVGDTPAGARPLFVLTGQVRAMVGTDRVSAGVDSIVVFYRTTPDEWVRLARFGGFPISGNLPFTAALGEEYGAWAVMWAWGASGRDTVTARVEFTATGRGIAP